jgi:hypothetical protein
LKQTASGIMGYDGELLKPSTSPGLRSPSEKLKWTEKPVPIDIVNPVRNSGLDRLMPDFILDTDTRTLFWWLLTSACLLPFPPYQMVKGNGSRRVRTHFRHKFTVGRYSTEGITRLRPNWHQISRGSKDLG